MGIVNIKSEFPYLSKMITLVADVTGKCNKCRIWQWQEESNEGPFPFKYYVGIFSVILDSSQMSEKLQNTPPTFFYVSGSPITILYYNIFLKQIILKYNDGEIKWANEIELNYIIIKNTIIWFEIIQDC